MMKIDERFQAWQFELVKESDGSLILKYENKSIFYIGSQLSIDNTTLDRICEDYLRIVSETLTPG